MTSHYEIASQHDISPADQATRLFEEARYDTEAMTDEAMQFMKSASVTSQIQFLRRFTDEVEGVLDDYDSRYYGAANTTLGLLEEVANDTSGHQLLAKVAKIDSARLGHRFHNKEDQWYHDDSLLHEAMQFSKTSLPVPGDIKGKLPVNANELEQAKMIAPDACAIYDAYYTPIGIYRVGTTDVEPLVADADSEVTLRVMHEPKVRDLVNDELGLDIRVLSVDEQLHLLDYMQSGNADRYKRMIATSQQLDGAAREQFAKAFLATEFGDDFGDALLDITEHTNPEQATHVFETILQLRQRTAEFARMFTGIDPELAESTKRAMNERITDALVALREVAVHGSLHEDVAPHRHKEGYESDGSFDITVDSMDKAMEIMDGLEATFATMHAITTASDLHISKVNEDTTQFTLYRLISSKEGNMLVYVRPKGGYEYDPKVEYGNRSGVEASVSFMVNPLNPHRLQRPKDRDAVSLRFDHEGRTVDELPDSPDRDPTRTDGLISVDISSGVGDPDSLAVRIGRLIAAGNRIRARRQGTADSLHHNVNYFNQEKYGPSEGFAGLAHGVIDDIELLRNILNKRRLARATQLSLDLAA